MMLDSVDDVHAHRDRWRGTVLDVGLIGAGPSNLSVAAHLLPHTQAFALYDRRRAFTWHDGLMLDGVKLQSSYFKDLIFLSDPKSPFTFFNYLHEKNRLYRYLHAEFDRPERREFESYFRWAGEKLESFISLETDVIGLEQRNDGFRILFQSGYQDSRNVVVGIGKQPFLAGNASGFAGPTVFHSSDYRHRRDDAGGFKGRDVIIVGGGQSAAEIVLDLISSTGNFPKSILWMTRSQKFAMFDETVLCNDIYTPSFATFFFNQSAEMRRVLNDVYKTSSDGIVGELLLRIYRRFYDLDVFHGTPVQYRMRVGQTYTGLEPAEGGRWRVSSHFRDAPRVDVGDVVIMATGYQSPRSPLMESLDEILDHDADGSPVFGSDYSARTQVPTSGRIFLQNMSSDRFGWMDPNLGGTSWRAATITNAILGRPVYTNSDEGTLIDWAGSR
ncbi:MAG: SidA/IucD/PvdA family monooxygenase [Telmatospirillum sp.]|nr:SidA/IucD/PvdA family monooxygenase [Telmatospirillum sp.]